MRRRTIPTTMQPDYIRWRAVAVGMTYEQVSDLLGESQRVMENSRKTGKPYYLFYGSLRISSTPSRWFYRFVVGFDKDEKVWMKSDPFGGVLSDDGKPSKPQILIPLEGATFSHFPRILDVRWTPSSGDYPMKYEVEIAFAAISGIREGGHICDTFVGVAGPYLAMGIPGMGPYRVRVRGHNLKGAGAWSDDRHFEFLQ